MQTVDWQNYIFRIDIKVAREYRKIIAFSTVSMQCELLLACFWLIHCIKEANKDSYITVSHL